jgi:SSS family solute:Na+ symporter
MGLMGLSSSYFSAILSTDSCLMAASGNIVTDIIIFKKELTHKKKNYNITVVH